TTRPGVDLNLVEVVAPERVESGAGECWRFGLRRAKSRRNVGRREVTSTSGPLSRAMSMPSRQTPFPAGRCLWRAPRREGADCPSSPDPSLEQCQAAVLLPREDDVTRRAARCRV